MENSFIPNRTLRLVAQLGVPLVLVMLYWNVFVTLWRFGRACLLTQSGTPCPVSWVELIQAGLTLVYALGVYFGMRLLTMVVVAQFVLPVETWDDRRKVVERLLAYARGAPGPALFVRDGQLIARQQEQQERKGRPGVVLVDSSSEVILQTDTEYVGTRGPGVVFTQRGQQVIPLDMRKQRRTAEQVKAITRDGLEVMADITVVFALDSGEQRLFRDWRDPDRPPYRHNPFSAYRAVYGKAVDARYKDVPWSELPALVAADVWRDLLIVRDLKSLFNDSGSGIPPLEALQDELTARLKPPLENNSSTMAFSRGGETAPGDGSREYQVLAARGIRVLSASISPLSIDAELKSQRVRNWQANWERRASERAARTDPVITAQREKGRIEGQAVVLEKATEQLRHELGLNNRPTIKAALQYLLHATQLLNREAAMYGEGTGSDYNLLDQLETWAASLPEDFRSGPNGAGAGE